MKSTSWVVIAGAVIAGCSVNGTTPVTAWGKKGVSMLDYRTDGGQCAVIAASGKQVVTPDGAKQAGGINGSNGATTPQAASGSANSGSAGNSGSASTPNTIGGSTYRDSANPDFVNRAAMQQRSQEMAAQRARSDALKSCLAGRGYTEFELTAAQRAELAKLPQGSDERRAYLYKLGTDEQVLATQAVTKKE